MVVFKTIVFYKTRRFVNDLNHNPWFTIVNEEPLLTILNDDPWLTIVTDLYRQPFVNDR